MPGRRTQFCSKKNSAKAFAKELQIFWRRDMELVKNGASFALEWFSDEQPSHFQLGTRAGLRGGQRGWKSRHKFRSMFYIQTGWLYWHVIFPVFLVVICGFCLLFAWMMFLAESLSSPRVPNLEYMYPWGYIQGRNEVRWRPVQEAVGVPCSKQVFRKQMHCM